MRIATFVVFCLLTLIAPVLVAAGPAGATTEAPAGTDPNDGGETGMTCCHSG